MKTIYLTIVLLLKFSIETSFSHCLSLEKIKFNSNLSVIGDYAFYNCKSIKQISLSDSVTELGREVFSQCESLEKITLSNKITQISSSLFRNCSSLVSVNIPNSVTEIQSSAFSNCISLKEILIPSSVKQIGWYAFRNCSNLTTVKINGCVALGRCSFIDCKNLKNVIFTSEIQDLGSNTFENCVSLKTITFPNIQDKSIHYVFLGCANLEKVIFAEGATEIILDASDFSDCKKLKSIELPPNTKIEWSESKAGKLIGSGNGMQYFGSILVDSDLSENELKEYYKKHNKYIEVVPLQENNSFRITMQGNRNIDSEFILFLLDLDLRGH